MGVDRARECQTDTLDHHCSQGPRGLLLKHTFSSVGPGGAPRPAPAQPRCPGHEQDASRGNLIATPSSWGWRCGGSRS